MSKIIGVTVGTPTSPFKMEQEIKPVKTINGVVPDANGNVEVHSSTEFTEEYIGKLVYVDGTGKLVPIILGEGLTIANGSLGLDIDIIESIQSLISSDGYVLIDSNGLYLKPKEGVK